MLSESPNLYNITGWLSSFLSKVIMRKSLIHEHRTFEFQEMNTVMTTILPHKAMGLIHEIM